MSLTGPPPVVPTPAASSGFVAIAPCLDHDYTSDGSPPHPSVIESSYPTHAQEQTDEMSAGVVADIKRKRRADSNRGSFGLNSSPRKRRGDLSLNMAELDLSSSRRAEEEGDIAILSIGDSCEAHSAHTGHSALTPSSPRSNKRKGSSSLPNRHTTPLELSPLASPRTPPETSRASASDSLVLASISTKKRKVSKSQTLPDKSGTVDSKQSRGKLIQFFGEDNVVQDASKIAWAPQPPHVSAYKLSKRFGESIPLDAIAAMRVEEASVAPAVGLGSPPKPMGQSPSGSSFGSELQGETNLLSTDEEQDEEEGLNGALSIDSEEDSDDPETQERTKELKRQKSALKIGRFFGDRSASCADVPKGAIISPASSSGAHIAPKTSSSSKVSKFSLKKKRTHSNPSLSQSANLGAGQSSGSSKAEKAHLKLKKSELKAAQAAQAQAQAIYLQNHQNAPSSSSSSAPHSPHMSQPNSPHSPLLTSSSLATSSAVSTGVSPLTSSSGMSNLSLGAIMLQAGPLSPSRQPANVDPLKLNRFFGERVDIVKSAELSRPTRTAVHSPPASGSPESILEPLSAPSSPTSPLKVSLSQNNAPLSSTYGAGSDTDLEPRTAAYDADMSSDVLSGGDSPHSPPVDRQSNNKTKAKKLKLSTSKKHSQKKLLVQQGQTSSSLPDTPSHHVVTNQPSSHTPVPVDPTLKRATSQQVIGADIPSKEASKPLKLGTDTSDRAESPTSLENHRASVNLSDSTSNDDFGVAISPPHGARRAHRLEPGLLSTVRPAIRACRSEASILQTIGARRASAQLTEQSRANISKSELIGSAPTSSVTPISFSAPYSARSASSSHIVHNVAPLSATRSAVRAKVERLRSPNATSQSTPIVRKISGNSLLMTLTRIEDMHDAFDESLEEEYEEEFGAAGAGTRTRSTDSLSAQLHQNGVVYAEGSEINRNRPIQEAGQGGYEYQTFAEGPVSPRTQIPQASPPGIVKRPSRDSNYCSQGSSGDCYSTGAGPLVSATGIPERDYSPPRRARRQSTQTNPNTSSDDMRPILSPHALKPRGHGVIHDTEERNKNGVQVYHPSSAQSTSFATNAVDQDEEESIGGQTDAEIWAEQVRQSQRSRKLRKMFGEQVPEDQGISIAPQSENVNWTKLNKQLGLGGGN